MLCTTSVTLEFFQFCFVIFQAPLECSNLVPVDYSYERLMAVNVPCLEADPWSHMNHGSWGRLPNKTAGRSLCSERRTLGPVGL